MNSQGQSRKALLRNTKSVIGVVEDDPIMGAALVQRLRLEGYDTFWAQTSADAVRQVQETGCQVLVCDIRLPDGDGEQLFRRLVPDLGATPVIFVTAFGDVAQAVRLMRNGADDYITKPFDVDQLLQKITALCQRQAIGDVDDGDDSLVGTSAAMQAVRGELARIKDANTPVMLLGATGVGKEVTARYLHNASARKNQPFIVVDCATIPVDRAESEMFGHEAGTLAGAASSYQGLVEQAGAGTLFLDEVSTLPPLVQSKLLRLLEDGRYRKLGGAQEKQSSARIVSATNASLSALMAEGKFRIDLYYRLNVIEIHIPPLRARREDIVPLAEHFLAQIGRRGNGRAPSLSSAAMAALMEFSWPGNVRELRNRLERAVAMSSGTGQLTASVIFPESNLLEHPEGRIASLAEAREQAERRHIEEALRQTGGEILKAAALLGVSRTTLWEKMRRLGL